MSTRKLTLYPSPHILMLLALQHRLPTRHERYPQIQKKVRNEFAGFHGEKRLLYPLSKFPSYCKVLPNIRLNFYSNHFQMDFILISSKFILILESKYYSDDLLFDETVHQVIQTKGEEFKVFEDPVLQAEEQAFQLTNWLEYFGLSNVPIEYYVVMTNSNTRLRIESTNTHHALRVISLQRLPSLFRELSNEHDNHLTVKQINHLSNQITHHNTPYLPDILKQNRIQPSELKRGNFCMNCGNLGMKMTRRRWQCPRCNHRDALAHENALKDYYLLYGKEITNRAFRKFTGLESSHTARDMLKKVATSHGDKYLRKYQLAYNYQSDDFDYLFHLNKMLKEESVERRIRAAQR